MAKFIATKDCFGFRNSFWKKGETVEAKAGEVPPKPFKPVEKPEKNSDKGNNETGNK